MNPMNPMNLYARAIFCVLCCLIPAQARNTSLSPIPMTDPRGQHFQVLKLNPQTQTLELYWQDSSGKPLKTFAALERSVQAQGKKLLAATNAGIFGSDFAPLGLHLQQGKTLHPINLNSGYGNFYLKPNGVFYFGNGLGTAGILETGVFLLSKVSARNALQSGPLLVQRGKINAAFVPGSSNRLIRSGVGVSQTGRVYWVLSSDRVNFYDFAAFFRDILGCPNALFLDGTISKFYVPFDVPFDVPKDTHSSGTPAKNTGEFAGFLTLLER
jgi:uncharacterized protein YigE (DUF2233 family)